MTSLRRAVVACACALATLHLAPATDAAELLRDLGGASGFGENVVPSGDDEFVSVDLAPIWPAGINLWGKPFASVFVNQNGNLTFDGGLTRFTPTALGPFSRVILAPMWLDIDIRETDPDDAFANEIYYDLDADERRLTVTYYDTGYFNRRIDLRNSFQLALTAVPGGGTGDLNLEYRYDRCEWTTGGASGGTDGFGGTEGVMGWSDGDDVNTFQYVGSLTPDILNLCTDSNVGVPGVFRWGFRDGQESLCGNGIVEPAAGEACEVDRPATCAPGFAGIEVCNQVTCQIESAICNDIDECAEGTDTCDANASCANTPGSFDCTCNAGFAGDGVTCDDIDECTEGTDNCDAVASCTNTVGSFECACPAGYVGDGVTCDDIDECLEGLDNCDEAAVWTNTPGSFK